MDTLRVDELIVPPSLLSLSYGKIYNRILSDEEKITHARHINLTLTGVATVFQEDLLTGLLDTYIKIWDLETGNCLKNIRSIHQIHCLKYLNHYEKYLYKFLKHF